MFVFSPHIFIFSIFLVTHTDSAAIHKQNDTLDILKNDVSQVNSAIENFTFDIIREIVEDSDEEATTPDDRRVRRSVEDSVEEQVHSLCQKQCEETKRIENQQIRDLKNEVKKLQDVVRLLQDQQKIIDILDRDNATMQRSEDTGGDNATEELSKMKTDLKNVIDCLNQTKEIIDLQKKKDEVLEQELAKQKEEIVELKTIVASLNRNSTVSNHTEDREEGTKSRRSSSDDSDLSGFRRLLKSIPEDDDVQTKLLDLQKALIKKKKDESLVTDLADLEKSLKVSDSGSGDKNLLKIIMEAVKKTEPPKSRNDDLDITNLSQLSEAINRLRPKEEDPQAQFQAMLNTLINRPIQQQVQPQQQLQPQQQQLTINPQQMIELTKKLAPNDTPYICVVDDGGVKAKGYRIPVDPPKNQFFPGQYPQPPYSPPRGVDAAGYEKPAGYQQQNGDFGQYQEELRQQIEGLQAAVDGLNRPEYLQRPEDKAMIADLGQQIGDLRNVVSNLNDYQRTKRFQQKQDEGEDEDEDEGIYGTIVNRFLNNMTDEDARKKKVADLRQVLDDRRTKRSVHNNQVESSEELFKLADRFRNMTDEERRNELNVLHMKVNEMTKQLNPNSAKARTASFPLPPTQSYAPEPAPKDLKRSFKNDFLADIIEKILEKIIDVIPAVVQKLFSFSLQEFAKVDPQDYDLQVLSKNLGVFSLLPIILMKLLKGVGAFLGMLRKNAFFRSFLMPALILGTVAGSVLFLIWWLQPDAANAQYANAQYASAQYPNTQYAYGGGEAADPNQYPPSVPSPSSGYQSSYNYPVYNRSYFNK